MEHTIYYNFSASCTNSNYIGFSARQPTLILSPGFIGNYFYFNNVDTCIVNCSEAPNQISGCFRLNSTGNTPNYPVYDGLSNPNFFMSEVTCVEENPCPVQQEYVYFKYCCPQGDKPENDYFAILTEPNIFQLGNVYFIGIESTSACTTVVSSTGLPSGIVLYQNISYTYESYQSCTSCTGSTSGCYSTPTPTPTIFYSSDTRCGDNILKRNECDPIVIFPMGVQCAGTNPTLTTIPDGSLSLIITGGTPPYSIYWSTGGNGLFLTNLSVGSYSAIVTDYYLDFTAYTTCFLTAPTPVPTETRITNTPTVTPTITPTPDPSYPSFCLTLTVGTPSQTVQLYFTQVGSLINNMPYYTNDTNGYNISWSISSFPNYWVMEGALTVGGVVNYDNTITPLNNWEFLNTQNQGTINGILGECTTYGNLCFSYLQSKSPSDPIRQNTVTLFYSGIVNAQPSWQSSDGTYILSWNSTYSRWVINFTTNPYYYNVINTNPAVPPISGWQQVGSPPGNVVRVLNGNCTPSTTSNVDLGGGSGGGVGGGTSSGGGLGGTTTTNNPSSGNVPFTEAVEVRDGVSTETTTTNQCECIAVRTITSYPGTAFYTDCSGNPAQIAVPGGSGINSRACICRRVGTTVSGGVYEEPCQSVQGSSGGGTVTNNCLDILGDSCTSNVTGSSTRSATTTAEDNGVINNGNITLRASGGFPPYQYSIDGGLIYKSTPLFNKLGAGTYSVIIKDSSGNTYTQSVVLVVPARPTIYQVSLQTTSTTPRSGQNVTTKQFASTINVTPSLPDGVVLLFDLIHTSNFKSSPTTTAATFNTNTLLKKNSINYSANTVSVETGTTLNTNSGCQQKIIYTNGRNETWTSINYSNGDSLSLNTSTTITKNSIDKCYVGDVTDNFILTNLTISGCTNCGVSNISV